MVCDFVGVRGMKGMIWGMTVILSYMLLVVNCGRSGYCVMAGYDGFMSVALLVIGRRAANMGERLM